ncbi:MAG: glycoside hydrolase family 3 C-terminal domain-containing protein, partial [Clostridia bacterium]|nr:glycoside hydrolase family 3 C-terminal domain-containing protein [Clostridia bacterium]
MKIEEILSRMSLKEKIFQLEQFNSVLLKPFAGWDATGPMKDLKLTEEDLKLTGSVLNSMGADRMQDIQKEFLEKNEQKIPLAFMHDVIHGYRTIYPINLGLACSFNLDVMRDCAEMAAQEAVLDGVNVTFAPMVDLARDARWGRVMETSGEDPYLNSQIAKATVEGYNKGGIATCVKHFAAYGGAVAGKDYAEVDMSEYTLREYYLPAYKAAIDAGVDMVMPSFNLLNGIPATGNIWLLQDVLRTEWGFDGVIISDYAAISEMIVHGYAEDEKDAAYKAMMAGVDVEMCSTMYAHNLEQLLQEEKITENQIDKAVLRVLRLKETLGLFEKPYGNVDTKKAKEVILCEKHREIARKAVEESAVLLKNYGVLPLDKNTKSVAVIGPHGDTGHVLGWWLCGGLAEETVTVCDGLRGYDKNLEVRYAKGCEIGWNSTDESYIPEAVELAKNSEAVVLCLGEKEEESGESNNKTNLDLPEVQYKLLEEVLTVNQNVVVLLFTGRPLAITRLNRLAPAILNVWWPGTECGSAVANLLFGKVVPSGKITMTFPYSSGQCPIYYNHCQTGRPSPYGRYDILHATRYLDTPNEPLYPFGYGLSYYKFTYSDVELTSNEMKRGD